MLIFNYVIYSKMHIDHFDRDVPPSLDSRSQSEDDLLSLIGNQTVDYLVLGTYYIVPDNFNRFGPGAIHNSPTSHRTNKSADPRKRSLSTSAAKVIVVFCILVQLIVYNIYVHNYHDT
jgi:hypothetical protein